MAEQSLARLDFVEAPALDVAESLERAGQRSLVYVGQKGAVVSPSKVRVGVAIAGTFFASSVLASAWLFAAAFGWPGLVGAGVFGALFGRQLIVPVKLRRVAALMMAEKYDEADALAQRIQESWPVNRVTRREALHARVQVASLRGNLRRAQRLQARAESLYRYAHERRTVQYRIHRYGCVITHANLGELTQAKARFLEAGDEPEGDYLQLLHWTCELMIGFCEGRCELDEDALHLRGRRGLEVVPGTPLLALAAWGFMQSGDEDMGAHLLSVVAERWEPRMARALPRFAPWVRARVGV